MEGNFLQDMATSGLQKSSFVSSIWEQKQGMTYAPGEDVWQCALGALIPKNVLTLLCFQNKSHNL